MIEPGIFRLGSASIDAIQFDGEKNSANDLIDWVNEDEHQHCFAYLEQMFGEYRVVLISNRTKKESGVVRKRYWLLRTLDGQFSSANPRLFAALYIPNDKEHDARVSSKTQ